MILRLKALGWEMLYLMWIISILKIRHRSKLPIEMIFLLHWNLKLFQMEKPSVRQKQLAVKNESLWREVQLQQV